jgi:hypothetical protein
MTICIGMLATDGIVIAADALESGGYLDRPVQKIMTWVASAPGSVQRFSAACVVTGAGDAGFIDAFTAELLSGLHWEMTMMEFESYAKEKVQDFYSKHVIPALSIDRNCDFSVLIGAAFGATNPRLFQTYKSTLRSATELCMAIGVGGEYANQLKEYFPFSGIRQTEVSAAAIISSVKDCVPGCGKYTDIVSLYNHRIASDEAHGSRLVPPPTLMARVSPLWIQEWERSFSVVWKAKQTDLYSQLIEEAIKPSDSQK